MTNIEKYNQVFIETLEVSESELKGLKYKSVPLWDSVGQMSLIAALEDEFGIAIDGDDIMEINSYENGLDILKKKYSVEF